MSPDTNRRYRDRCATRPPKLITKTITLNHRYINILRTHNLTNPLTLLSCAFGGKGRTILLYAFFLHFSRDLNRRKHDHKQALWCGNGMYMRIHPG